MAVSADHEPHRVGLCWSAVTDQRDQTSAQRRQRTSLGLHGGEKVGVALAQDHRKQPVPVGLGREVLCGWSTGERAGSMTAAGGPHPLTFFHTF